VNHLKIGLEIHQRLDSAKLFCNCPSAFSEHAPDFIINRKLHPVFSELGETDAASKAEFLKNRIFEYQVFHSNNCLVETDEEPPGLLNTEALKIALNISSHLNAVPVDEVHIMRKMVLDGSNTSGFQRTSIIALNGSIESSKGKVRIPLISLEEESSGIISSSESKVTYRLDRLGIPLVEICTAPDIKDGAHLREVAEKIGMVLRATGHVARGLGTIRQDVNISTEGGARVEIKGAQDLKLFETYVDIESKRQLALIKLLNELRHRKALPVKKHQKDLTNLFANTNAKFIKSGIDSGSIVLGQKLPNHKSILGTILQPGKRYGTELSDYAKLAGVKGIMHSDEDLSKYSISETEQKAINTALDISSNDAFVLVVAPNIQAENAMSYVLSRANMNYVPEETRRPNPDGTTSFMRPLPGRARLYPETDVPPIPLTKELLSSIEKTESLEDKTSKLEKLLNKEMAAKMLKSRHLKLFETLVDLGIDPMLVATTIENTVVSLRRDGIEFSNLEKTLVDLFTEYKNGTFVKAAIPDIMKFMAKGARVDAVLKVYRLQKLSGKDLEKLLVEQDYNMQAVMTRYRLQVDPQEVAVMIKKKPKDIHKEYV